VLISDRHPDAMSLQAAASRLMYSYGRDKMIFGSGLLSKFSQTRHVPPYALLVAALIPAIIVIGAKFSTDALTKIISFARARHLHRLPDGRLRRIARPNQGLEALG